MYVVLESVLLSSRFVCFYGSVCWDQKPMMLPPPTQNIFSICILKNIRLIFIVLCSQYPLNLPEYVCFLLFPFLSYPFFSLKSSFWYFINIGLIVKIYLIFCLSGSFSSHSLFSSASLLKVVFTSCKNLNGWLVSFSTLKMPKKHYRK